MDQMFASADGMHRMHGLCLRCVEPVSVCGGVFPWAPGPAVAYLIGMAPWIAPFRRKRSRISLNASRSSASRPLSSTPPRLPWRILARMRKARCSNAEASSGRARHREAMDGLLACTPLCYCNIPDPMPWHASPRCLNYRVPPLSKVLSAWVGIFFASTEARTFHFCTKVKTS